MDKFQGVKQAQRILVTGFLPFGAEAVNPSQILAERMAELRGVAKVILPVEYNRGPAEFLRRFQPEDFDFALMIGQGGNRSRIDLERVALNLADCESPDESGDKRLLQPLDGEAPEALINPLPLHQWAKVLSSEGLPVDVSFSAGAFVCNALYFQSLLKKTPEQKTLFVHVPFLPNQRGAQKPRTFSLDFDLMEKTLLRLLDLILEKN